MNAITEFFKDTGLPFYKFKGEPSTKEEYDLIIEFLKQDYIVAYTINQTSYYMDKYFTGQVNEMNNLEEVKKMLITFKECYENNRPGEWSESKDS